MPDGTGGCHHSHITARDRLNQCYFAVFNTRTTTAVIATSILLLVTGIANPMVCATHWYHVTEGVVTTLFALEIILRLMVQKSSFWSSAYNLVEAGACCFCLLVFSIISIAPRSTRAEHQLLIVLRFVAQGLRVAGVLKHNSCLVGAGDGARSQALDVFIAGGGLPLGRTGSHANVVDGGDPRSFPV